MCVCVQDLLIWIKDWKKVTQSGLLTLSPGQEQKVHTPLFFVLQVIYLLPLISQGVRAHKMTIVSVNIANTF